MCEYYEYVNVDCMLCEFYVGYHVDWCMWMLIDVRECMLMLMLMLILMLMLLWVNLLYIGCHVDWCIGLCEYHESVYDDYNVGELRVMLVVI